MRDETDKEDRAGASHIPGEVRDNSSENSPYTATRHVRKASALGHQSISPIFNLASMKIQDAL